MIAIQDATERVLRGPRASRILRSIGIDSRRYWLLIDLFGRLSERGEMLDQLGRNGVALQAVTWIYAAFSALISLLAVVAGPAPDTYLSVFLIFTTFLLFTVLLSETGNSLVNPVEGLVLAHQPVDGATYTAAKLTHLARIVLYLVPAINAVPAFAGLALKPSRWFYPLVHLFAALAVGTVIALLCCALYGWLIRLLPATRLKAAGQLAGTLPFLGMIWWRPLRDSLARSHVGDWLPAHPAATWILGLALAAAAMAIAAAGIRSLSADYLIRVSSIVHSGSARRARMRKSRIGALVARLFGGQQARAGFDFVTRMMRRDYYFRQQVVVIVIVGLLWLARAVVHGWRTNPLSGRFTTVHLLPHIVGIVLLFICSFLPYGGDFKGAWTFLSAPREALGRFARGVYAALFIPMIVVPHGIMLLLFAWPWGVWRAGLFVAFSVAVSSVYLALEIRLIDSVPFTRQVDPKRGATLGPLMIMGGLGMAIAVGLQYWFVFRSTATVAMVTGVVGVVAYLLTRSSLGACEAMMRYSLGLLSAESGSFYKEIDM